MLSWNYGFDWIEIKNEKGGTSVILQRGREGGIFMQTPFGGVEIYEEDIGDIVYENCSLFKAGFMMFRDTNGRMLEYQLDDGHIVSCGMSVPNKQKDYFKMLLAILEENGFEVRKM